MKKIIKYSLCISIVLTSFLSCSNDNNELFDETPTERVNDKNAELLNLLLSQENGYKGVYFPKNDEYGGFTFYMKFNDDGTVKMTSDFNSQTDIESSSYDVRLGTSTELVFTTRNHIHKLSNNLIGGLIGTGFEGTSVFQYISNDNGTITFKDIRNDGTSSLVLEPTGFNDFDTESIENVEKSRSQRANFIPSITNPVFQILKIENGSGTTSFNLNYNLAKFHATPTFETIDGVINQFNFGIAFTNDGLTISPSLDFEGEMYKDFIYDADANSYVSQVNGTVATISFSNEPAYYTADVNNLAQLNTFAFFYIPALGASPLTSLAHDQMMEGVNGDLNTLGYTFQYYLLRIDLEGDNCNTFLGLQAIRNSNGQEFRARYCFNPTIQDNKLFLEYTGPADNNSVFFESSMMPIIEFFSSAQGMVYVEEGSFNSSTSSFTNSASTFTSLDSPEKRVYGVWIPL